MEVCSWWNHQVSVAPGQLSIGSMVLFIFIYLVVNRDTESVPFISFTLCLLLLVCCPLLPLSLYSYSSHFSVFLSSRLQGASGSSFSCTVLMYIWSHLCLVVCLCPFIFSLILPLFSLISSALSAPLLLLSSFFSSTVHCWSTFLLPLLSLFSRCSTRILSSSCPQSPILLSRFGSYPSPI